MRQKAGLLAALALVAAPAAAQEPAQQGRIWKGTLGDAAITACFVDEAAFDGVYYLDTGLEPIRLAQLEGTDPPELAEMRGYDDASGATWTLRSTEDSIAGERTADAVVLPIRLTAVLVALPKYGSACETDAFLEPLLAGGTVTTKRESFEGNGYTALAYQGPKRAGIEDYAVSSFALDPVRPGDAAVNRALAKALPDGTAAHVMGQCVGLSLPGGIGGSMDEAWVPTMITARWLGIRRSGSDYCGGAHPNNSLTLVVYDRDSGAEVDPSTWFKPGALVFYDWESEVDPKPAKRPIAGLSQALAKALRAKWPARGDEDECGLPDELEGFGWDIGLTREGPVFVPQLPHVMFACTEEVAMPWKEARPFLSAEGRAVMASLR